VNPYLFSQVAPAAREVLLDRERLAEMYRTRTQEALAVELGTTIDTLRRALRYHRIPSHPRGWILRGTIVPTPRASQRITREGVKRLVWRLYLEADRCPPVCPGREECIEPGGECTLATILEGERNGNHDSD